MSSVSDEEEVDTKPRTAWVKFKEVTSLASISVRKGCQYVVMYGGCHVVFIRPDTEEEFIFRAVNVDSGEGVQCLDVARKTKIFAFAEKCMNPRIMVFSFPNFSCLAKLQGGSMNGYLSIAFSEKEYLVSLGTFPDYKITVWNWRTGEVLAVESTEIHEERQILRCNFGTLFCVAQMPYFTNQLSIWNVYLCHSICRLMREDVEVPIDQASHFCDCLWSPDGVLFVLEKYGDIYSIEGDQRTVNLSIKWDGIKGQIPPCMTWFKGGIIISGPDGQMKHFSMSSKRKGSVSKGTFAPTITWKLVWTAEPKYPISAICAVDHFGSSDLFSITHRGELYWLCENELVEVKNYGTGIIDFNFIYPQAEYVVTLNDNGYLIIWTRDTGKMVSGLQLGMNFHGMHASPTQPLLVVGSTDGNVILVNALDIDDPKVCGRLNLCYDSITLLVFTSSGKHLLVGAKEAGHIFVIKAPPCEKVFVMAYVKLHMSVADVCIFEGERNIRVAFIVQNLPCCEKGGHEIHIFKSRIHDSAEITKPLVLEMVVNNGYSYVSVCHNPNVDNQLIAVPHRSRHIHLFILETVSCSDGTHCMSPRLTGALSSGHQLRRVRLVFQKDVLVSWGGDGLVVLRCGATLRPLAAFTEHHRADGGVARVRAVAFATPPPPPPPRSRGSAGRASPQSQRQTQTQRRTRPAVALSLGCDGALVCTDLRAPNWDSESSEEEIEKVPPKVSTSQEMEGEGEETEEDQEEEEVLLYDYKLPGAEKNINWVQQKKNLKDREDLMAYLNVRKSYQKTLNELKRQVLMLLDANLKGPEEEKLPIGEFDLDEATRRKKILAFTHHIHEIINQTKAEISAKNALVAKIKGLTWDKMLVKSKHIQAFLEGFFVESFALLKPDVELLKQREVLDKRRRMTWALSKNDSFYPWVSSTDLFWVREGPIQNPTQLGKRKTLTEITEEESDTYLASPELTDSPLFSGSSSQKYVSLSPYRYSQFELTTYQHIHEEVMVLKKTITDLQEFFNIEFEKVFRLKERELGLLAEKNNRRRHLLSELNITGVDVEDYEWNAFEEPETLMTVQESEVPVPPYLTPSEEELRERKRAEAEALRLALLADDFRERALIKMMHGVLELRWEDIIKKDIPKPKYLVEKLPEDWNEDEIRGVRDYDAKVLDLMDQRRLYRKICGKEYEDIMSNEKESMLKFDKNLERLLCLKMEIQACVEEETLKILRGRLKIYERLKLEAREKEILKKMSDTDEDMAKLQSEVHDLTEAKKQCRHEYELLQARERNLDRSFRREFRDGHNPINNQLSKLYRRRPKVLQKAQMSVALLEELSNCTVQEPGEIPSYLSPDSLEFLHAIDLLDQHSHAPHGASDHAWNTLCRMRRNKIECELKLKAMALQLAECDSTIGVMNKMLAILRDRLIMFSKDLKDVRDEKLDVIHNVHLQLVIKQGFTEIADADVFGKFSDCVLINRKVVENINSLILEAGDKKLKAMHQVTNFHRIVMCKEWEHKKLRMIIEDLKDKLNYISKTRLTRDLQLLLKQREMGLPLDSGKDLLERQINAYKQAYDSIIRTTKETLTDMNKRLRRAKRESHKLDESIVNLNVDVNELLLQKDITLQAEQEKFKKHNMKLIVWRANAVRKIQQQFHKMLLLQTELELLRLKTYPTLKYNSLCLQ